MESSRAGISAADRANGKPARALRIAREQGRFEDEGWRVRKDGTSFWRGACASCVRICRLLATGYSDVAAGVRGDFPILRKPYELHQLSQAIANLPR